MWRNYLSMIAENSISLSRSMSSIIICVMRDSRIHEGSVSSARASILIPLKNSDSLT